MIIEVTGKFDYFHVLQYKEQIQDSINKGDYAITMDLAQCNFVDSSGIGFLLTHKELLRKYGGRLEVINKPDSLTRIMKKAGLYDLL